MRAVERRVRQQRHANKIIYTGIHCSHDSADLPASAAVGNFAQQVIPRSICVPFITEVVKSTIGREFLKKGSVRDHQRQRAFFGFRALPLRPHHASSGAFGIFRA
jgi:hypothetical protein